MIDMSPTSAGAIAGAIVGAVIAGLGKIWVGIILEAEKHRNSEELKKLQAQLDIATETEKGENKARRDYLYDARKRLYTEIEPLLFQLSEASEEALYRVYSLARSTRTGEIDHWLALDAENKYYMASTMFKLIAPIAIIRMIRQRLTLVDLTVDADINFQYTIARIISLCWTDDFDLARGGTIQETAEKSPFYLEYHPNVQDWETQRVNGEAVYWRQGIPVGVLESAADLLIVTDSNNAKRPMTFGEFMQFYSKPGSEIAEYFGKIIADMFIGFHPTRRPVLWRVLIVQAIVNKALYQARGSLRLTLAADDNISNSSVPQLDGNKIISELMADSRLRLSKDEALSPQESAAIDTARIYLEARLPQLFSAPKTP